MENYSVILKNTIDKCIGKLIDECENEIKHDEKSFEMISKNIEDHDRNLSNLEQFEKYLSQTYNNRNDYNDSCRNKDKDIILANVSKTRNEINNLVHSNRKVNYKDSYDDHDITISSVEIFNRINVEKLTNEISSFINNNFRMKRISILNREETKKTSEYNCKNECTDLHNPNENHVGIND